MEAIKKIKDMAKSFSEAHSNIMFTLGRIDAKLDSINMNLDKMKETHEEVLEKEEKPKEVD